MKQTTAMQTLIDKLKSIEKPSNADTRLLLTAVICDAEGLLELEKQQIMDAFSDGYNSGENKALGIPEKSRKQYESPEQYYTETFKTE